MRRRATLALTVALGCAVGGCADKPSPRDRVRAYIQDANAVQRAQAPALGQSERSYRAFAQGKLSGVAAVRSLTDADHALRDVRARLARLHPPPEALALHRSLLRVFDLEVDVAGQTTELARYQPAAGDAVAPLDAINRRLNARLSTARTTASQVRALSLYVHGLDRVRRALRGLTPPPVLRGTQRVQLSRLDATRRLAVRLRAALGAKDARRVARLLLRFRRLARSGSSGRDVAARSLTAYDDDLEKIARARQDVEAARAQLDRTIGG